MNNQLSLNSSTIIKIYAAGIAFILYFSVILIAQWNSTVCGILIGVLGVYLVFIMGKALAFLYSDV